jgi:hypothetical protein
MLCFDLHPHVEAESFSVDLGLLLYLVLSFDLGAAVLCGLGACRPPSV